MQTLYTAQAATTGGRDGRVSSKDGQLEFDVRIPKEMGGAGGATNPEQLFAAGYSACFDSALNLVARGQGVDLKGSVVDAEVSIGKEGEAYKLAVKLTVTMPGVEKEVAQKLVEAAHQVCPYSNATRGNVEVELVVA
ncbi:organic hydroperoxide resistance protein [Fulvitalea axinellae]|uniref:Organic hydroperoxide resistance protein n=1 Tax=Fulvitalea axinellae TaxID=1182444 RepID=A0AAU9CLZ8_9BACT|nr:organic hydroperoxide resistance protein [Fulvitalea axinellae]